MEKKNKNIQGMGEKRKIRQADRNRRRPYIRQFYRNNRTACFFCLLVSVLAGVINLSASVLMKELTDLISQAPGAKPLGSLVARILSLIGLLLALYFFQYFNNPRFFKRAMQQYKNYTYGRLAEKSISAFQSEETANYISALSNDASSIEANYLEQQFTLIVDAVLFFGALSMMLFYSPLLTAVSIGLFLLPLIAAMLAGNRLKEAEKQVSDQNTRFTAMLKDSLNGFSVVKSFKAEKAILGLFAKSNEALENAKCRRKRLGIVIGGIGSAAGMIAQFGVFLAGAFFALYAGSITAGVVLAFVQLANYVIGPIKEVPGILANRRAALALIDKLALALECNTREEREAIPRELKQGIQLKDVSFGYEQGKEILHQVNTYFEAGKSYAVVGASGSGKSTLLNLLMASHEEYSGNIFYDDRELRTISTGSLYDLISVIQQNVFLFNTSIRDNVTMFREFDDAEIEKAVKLSGLSSLAEQRGMEYLCGENGNGLSGGEKQRVSIARSLLRKSPVLLVDEATAALDPRTACQVSEAILGLKNLTRIVVTHSLDGNLLRQYDRILTMKAGQIVESGTFQELMEKKGYFYSLYMVSQ